MRGTFRAAPFRARILVRWVIDEILIGSKERWLKYSFISSVVLVQRVFQTGVYIGHSRYQ